MEHVIPQICLMYDLFDPQTYFKLVALAVESPQTGEGRRADLGQTRCGGLSLLVGGRTKLIDHLVDLDGQPLFDRQPEQLFQSRLGVRRRSPPSRCLAENGYSANTEKRQNF